MTPGAPYRETKSNELRATFSMNRDECSRLVPV